MKILHTLGSLTASIAFLAVAGVACGSVQPAPTLAPTPTVVVPLGEFGPGTYVVGSDIQPGTYRTAGQLKAGDNCVWSRLRDTTGDQSAFITGDVGWGPMTVTIKKTDGAFETIGCQPWTEVLK